MPKVFRKRGLSLGYLHDLLTALDKPLTFNELYAASGFKHKRSFLNYLDWLRGRGFIDKKPISKLIKEVGNMGYNQTRRVMIYKLTPKGLQFLEMIN